jgi:hypothetical protein
MVQSGTVSKRTREVIGRGTLLVVSVLIAWAGWRVTVVAYAVTIDQTFPTGRREVMPWPIWCIGIGLIAFGILGAAASLTPLRWLERLPVRTRSLGDHPDTSGWADTFTWWV